MWRSPPHTGLALVALAALLGDVARLEAGVVAGSVARVDASKTTISVTIDREEIENLPQSSRRLDELALLVPGMPSGGVRAGHLPSNWSFDPGRLRASGPAISGGKFRFDFPAGWKPPSKLGLEGYFGGKLEFKLMVPVNLQPPIKVDTDLGRWLDLPQTIQLGSSILLSGERNKMGTPVDWTITALEPAGVEVLRDGASAVYGSDALSGVVNIVLRDSPPDEAPYFIEDAAVASRRYTDAPASGVSSALRDGPSGEVPHFIEDAAVDSAPRGFADSWGLQISYGGAKTRLAVEGRNPYGETLVRGEWTPTVTPPCHHPPARPLFGGLTEVVAPHETFCVCGQVGELGQWGGLRLGGASLGAPIVATSSSAVFLPPQGLAAGTYPLTYDPWGTGGGTGLSTSYIDVRGKVDDKKIRSGGTTPLTLEILGTDRVFPVTLTNTTPAIIDLEGGLRQEITTSGGSPNQIQRLVTGKVPGTYTVDYEVALPTCPCDASNQRVAEAAGDEYLNLVNGYNRELANRWMLRQPSAATSPESGSHELRFGAGYRDADVGSLSLWPAPPSSVCVHLGGPVACPAGLPPGSFSDRFVPGGTNWTTPAGDSVFVPERIFVSLRPEFGGATPSNDFQATGVEQPALPSSEVFAPGSGSGRGSAGTTQYGVEGAGELDGQRMHPQQATDYKSAISSADLGAPEAKPTYSQEFLGGVEFEVARSVSLGVRYVHRNLPRVLEDLDCQDSWQLNLGTGDRYRARLDWPVAAGAKSGACRSTRQRDSGLFYFSDPGHQEVLVKVLDGCSVNNRYWVFASGLTNVEYKLNVTDAKSGQTKTYSPPAGQAFQPIVDTQAFATCP